ncbi:MAG: radical SAM protein [Elusimicrobia bacterium]|nr:radical SAM protein [Elusimicrobiota bacterium]
MVHEKGRGAGVAEHVPHPGSGKIQKLVLFTGFSCNSHCHFCIDLNKRDLPDKSTSQIVAEMVQARSKGVDYLELIGGETTVRGDFIPIVRAAKKLGFKDVVVVTNGRMLSYPEFAKQTVEAGVSDLIFSIHGHNAKLHDELTYASGAFDELVKGIENVRALGFERIFANCTVVKQNMKHMPDIGRLFIKLNIHHAEFIFVDPTYGGAYTNFHGLVPKISEAAPYMRKTLDIGRAWGTRDWCVRYVPLCHFSDYLDQISEIREVELFRTRHWAPDFQNEDVGPSRRVAGRSKTERCEGCSLYDSCEGLWKEYLRQYGDEELTPVVKAHA